MQYVVYSRTLWETKGAPLIIVFIIYCYGIYYPKIWWFKTEIIKYLSWFSVLPRIGRMILTCSTLCGCWLGVVSSEDSAGLNIQDDALICPAVGAECGQGAPLSLQPEHLYMASSCGVGFLQHGGLVLRRVFCTNEYFMKQVATASWPESDAWSSSVTSTTFYCLKES